MDLEQWLERVERRLEDVEDQLTLVKQRQETTDLMFRTMDQKIDRLLRLATIQSSATMNDEMPKLSSQTSALEEMMKELRTDVELLKRATVSEWEK